MIKVVIDCNICNKAGDKEYTTTKCPKCGSEVIKNKNEILHTVEIKDRGEITNLVCPKCKSTSIFIRDMIEEQ